MPEVIDKKGSNTKIDHPSRDPNYNRAVIAGKKRFKKMKFENEADKRDYMRRVRKSDFNVPGMPALFNDRVAPSNGYGPGKPTDILPCGHKWTKLTVTTKGEMEYSCKYGGTYTKSEMRSGIAAPPERACPRVQKQEESLQ